MIPTEHIAVRDTEWLLATFGEHESVTESEEAVSEAEESAENSNPSTAESSEGWSDPDDDLSEEELIAELEARWAEEAEEETWRPPREEREWMRYQLQVTLIDEWSIP